MWAVCGYLISTKPGRDDRVNDARISHTMHTGREDDFTTQRPWHGSRWTSRNHLWTASARGKGLGYMVARRKIGWTRTCKTRTKTMTTYEEKTKTHFRWIPGHAHAYVKWLGCEFSVLSWSGTHCNLRQTSTAAAENWRLSVIGSGANGSRGECEYTCLRTKEGGWRLLKLHIRCPWKTPGASGTYLPIPMCVLCSVCVLEQRKCRKKI